MSTFTLMRLYLKYQSMPRLPLPCIGYAGTIYSAPLIDRHRYALMEDHYRTTTLTELAGASKILVKGESMGSYFFRRYSTSAGDIKKAEKERQDKNKFKLKTQQTIKIMVVSETGSISAMTLEEANKLAKEKGLNLVHITDPKKKPVQSEKEIYKLVSRLGTVEEEEEEEMEGEVEHKSAKDSKPKEVKTVLMKSNIGEHDANARINNMKKWIKKGHRIRVMISQVGDKGNAEAVFKNIETQIAEVEGQIQQKITKGNEVRFYVGPPKQVKSVNKVDSPTNKVKGSQDALKDGTRSDDEDSESDDDEPQAGRTARRS